MRVGPSSSQPTVSLLLRLFLLSAALLQQAAIATTDEPQLPHHHVAVENRDQDSALPHATPRLPSLQLRLALASGALLDKIGHLFTTILPDSLIDPDLNYDENGGLFGDEGNSLAWGGSTLEVVKTQASYLTRPAAFGPRIVDDNGLRGTLRPISDFYKRPSSNDEVETSDIRDLLAIDNYGCPYKGGPGWRNEHGQDRDKFPGEDVMEKESKPSDWIALIERGGNCSFIDKVRVAQALKAMAVVVGDAPSPGHEGRANDPGLSGRLVTMFAPGDTGDIFIPSTFVTRPSYVDLIRLVEEATEEEQEECADRKKQGKACKSKERGVQIILWRDDVMWEWPLIDLAFILLMLPSFMTLVTIIVHRVRMIHQRRKERAPEVAVLNLPCLIWRGNGQPWEKVEDATVVGGPGAEALLKAAKSGDAEQTESPTSRLFVYRSKVGAWLGRRFQRRSTDMERGLDETDAGQSALLLAPSQLESSSDEAGPSTLPSTTSSAPPTVLRTTPISPPSPPSDQRTYYSCDECAICLSDFVDGDMVRVLPCGHVFHLDEIDSWLLKVKKLCPICKRDITIPVPPMIPAPSLHPTGTEGASPSATVNEHTPLLADQED